MLSPCASGPLGCQTFAKPGLKFTAGPVERKRHDLRNLVGMQLLDAPLQIRVDIASRLDDQQALRVLGNIALPAVDALHTAHNIHAASQPFGNEGPREFMGAIRGHGNQNHK